MDHPVGPGDADAEGVQVGKRPSERFGASRLGGPRGRVRAGKSKDRVAAVEEVGDDGGPDQAGTAGDKYTHGTSLRE